MTFVRRILRFLRLIATAVTRTLTGTAGRALGFVESWLLDAKHALYGLAVTRILLGATGLGLLASNWSTRYYTLGSGSAWNGEAAQASSDFPNLWLFSGFHRLALHDTWFTLAYLALGALAVLVVLGWRMKLVLPVFFVGWVSFAEMNGLLGDQGDNMYRITLLTLLFADTSRRWSLDARRKARMAAETPPETFVEELRWIARGGRLLPGWLTTIMHNLALVAVTCHVCFVYASGALYKAQGDPWAHGYAIYNPLHVAQFSPWPGLADLLTTWAPLVVIISWSSIILQMSFPMALLNRTTRIIALVGICSFHVGIAVLMGLPWFSLAMIAIDAIFIRDVTWGALSSRVRTSWHQARTAT